MEQSEQKSPEGDIWVLMVITHFDGQMNQDVFGDDHKFQIFKENWLKIETSEGTMAAIYNKDKVIAIRRVNFTHMMRVRNAAQPNDQVSGLNEQPADADRGSSGED